MFPCNHAPNKSPRTRRGFYDATTNPATVNGYWNANPGASIGMPTGRASRILVLDVDVDPAKGLDGEADLREWEPARRSSRSPRRPKVSPCWSRTSFCPIRARPRRSPSRKPHGKRACLYAR